MTWVMRPKHATAQTGVFRHEFLVKERANARVRPFEFNKNNNDIRYLNPLPN
jgi:hypothetical protein